MLDVTCNKCIESQVILSTKNALSRHTAFLSFTFLGRDLFHVLNTKYTAQLILVEIEKLDGVGPVYNRPSPNGPKNVTCDKDVTCDILHVAYGGR